MDEQTMQLNIAAFNSQAFQGTHHNTDLLFNLSEEEKLAIRKQNSPSRRALTDESHLHSLSHSQSGNNMSILNKLQQYNQGQLDFRTASGQTSGQEAEEELDPDPEIDDDAEADDGSPSHQPVDLPPSSADGTPIKATGNGSGSSCHQCKSRRSLGALIFCCNSVKRKTKQQTKTVKGVTKRAHLCRKKYCAQCLIKFYREKAPKKSKDSEWACPACRGICICAACRRQKAKPSQASGPGMPQMSPATSLACGLVYYKDLLKFKLDGPTDSADMERAFQILHSRPNSLPASNATAAAAESASKAPQSQHQFHELHPQYQYQQQQHLRQQQPGESGSQLLQMQSLLAAEPSSIDSNIMSVAIVPAASSSSSTSFVQTGPDGKLRHIRVMRQ